MSYLALPYVMDPPIWLAQGSTRRLYYSKRFYCLSYAAFCIDKATYSRFSWKFQAVCLCLLTYMSIPSPSQNVTSLRESSPHYVPRASHIRSLAGKLGDLLKQFAHILTERNGVSLILGGRSTLCVDT